MVNEPVVQLPSEPFEPVHCESDDCVGEEVRDDSDDGYQSDEVYGTCWVLVLYVVDDLPKGCL